MTEDPAAAIAELISGVEDGVPAVRVQAVVAAAAAKHAHRMRLLEQLRADPGALVSGANSMPMMLQRIIGALIDAGATSLRLPRCDGCGAGRLLPGHLDGRPVCSTCYGQARARAITCHRCGNERRLGSSFGDADYCGACWRGMYDNAEAMFLGAARDRAPHIDPAALAMAFGTIRTTPGRRLRLALDFVQNGHGWFEEPATGPALFSAFYAALLPLVPRLAPLVCGHCRQDRPLANVHEGLRCCARCYTARNARTCGGCRRTAPIASRRPDGTPLCQSCAKALPNKQAHCSRCGMVRPVAFRGPDGPVCSPCRGREKVGTCTRCGRNAPCRFAGTPRAVCENCRKPTETCSRCSKERRVSTRDENGAALCPDCNRITEPCTDCGRERHVSGRAADGMPLCEYCYPRHPASFRDCTGCGKHAKLRRSGFCDRCTADDRLTSLFPPEVLRRSENARNLLDALRAGNNPRTVLNAFGRKRSIELLRAILAAPGPPTHATIDRLGTDQATRSVRALLVEHGFLPARDLHLGRFEAWIVTVADGIGDEQERQAFVQFARWQHLRNLRARNEPLHPSLASSRRTELRTVIELLAWARDRGKALATLEQADIDRWAMTGSQPYLVAKFLAWARANRRCRPLAITRPPRRYLMAGGTPDEIRSERLTAILGDASILPGTRLAAALVLLFGISPLRISRIRVDDVEHREGTTAIRIGKTPLQLPGTLAALAAAACADRSAQRMLGPGKDHEWLFPGARPGMHLAPASLVRRLATVGVAPASARTGALTSLAQQLPPVVLADLTGIHIGTAIRWANATAASNARYAGLLLDRAPLEGRVEP